MLAGVPWLAIYINPSIYKRLYSPASYNNHNLTQITRSAALAELVNAQKSRPLQVYRDFTDILRAKMCFKVTNLFDCPCCAYSFGFIFHYHVLSAIMAGSPVYLRIPPDND
ncbi:hypothetical protein YT21_24035 [Salmonella enterica subsp. enterica serovar Newport]|nr:hypothetical protein [Salmonella enterica subsp. enterica serovar Newport]